jgi:outer membrane protein assembly factor BamA
MLGFSIKRLFLSIGLLLLSAGESTPQNSSTHWKLSTIEFEGLTSQTPANLIPLTKLTIGQTITVAEITSAMERLSKTGLLSQLSYRYKYKSDQLQVTFIVKENSISIPCIFDNFVWFSDKEIQSAIQADIPWFEGKAPEFGSIMDLISESLTKLLKQRQLPGEINYILSTGSLAKPEKEHIFSIKGIRIPLCSLQFSGARGLSRQLLLENSKLLLEYSYSSTFARDYVKNNYPLLYAHHGYWQARFEEPKIRLAAEAPNCPAGIDMTVTIDEGLQYHWAGAQWHGNQLFLSHNLDKLMSMKNGDVADDRSIERGLKAVRKAYGQNGHLAIKLESKPLFTTTSADLFFEINITEGPQYKMGKLRFAGLSEGSVRIIKEGWGLPPDAIFDESYLDKARMSINIQLVVAGERNRTMVNTIVDNKTLTVDVEFSRFSGEGR